jgi:hypothetical protein
MRASPFYAKRVSPHKHHIFHPAAISGVQEPFGVPQANAPIASTFCYAFGMFS